MSRSQASALSEKLDLELSAWLIRGLENAYPYLVIDARYEQVRRADQVVSQGVLVAVGISEEGYQPTFIHLFINALCLDMNPPSHYGRNRWSVFILFFSLPCCDEFVVNFGWSHGSILPFKLGPSRRSNVNYHEDFSRAALALCLNFARRRYGFRAPRVIPNFVQQIPKWSPKMVITSFKKFAHFSPIFGLIM